MWDSGYHGTIEPLAQALGLMQNVMTDANARKGDLLCWI
jgi:hypothetical protein